MLTKIVPRVRVETDGTVASPPRPRYDLVVVGAGVTGEAAGRFVAEQHGVGGDILAVCTGSGLLAGLGLLDGRKATSNSLFIWRLARDYPAVHWISLRDRTDRRFIVSEPPLRIVTTAGVSAGIDGALHYVRAWFGLEIAEAAREYIEWPLAIEA